MERLNKIQAVIIIFIQKNTKLILEKIQLGNMIIMYCKASIRRCEAKVARMWWENTNTPSRMKTISININHAILLDYMLIEIYFPEIRTKSKSVKHKNKNIPEQLSSFEKSHD